MTTLRELTVPRQGQDLQKVLKQLMQEQQNAQDMFDHARAMEIQVEIDEVATAISGNEPVVGGFGTGGNRTY